MRPIGVVAGFALGRRNLGASTARPWHAPQQQHDRDGARQPDHAHHRHRRTPGHHRDQTGGDRGQCHLAEIASKVVGAERAARAWPLISRSDEVGRDRVLGARSDAAHDQRCCEYGDAGAGPEKQVGRGSASGADREHRGSRRSAVRAWRPGPAAPPLRPHKVLAGCRSPHSPRQIPPARSAAAGKAYR